MAATVGAAGFSVGRPAAAAADATAAQTRAADLTPGTLREYWLSVESFDHNTVPNGADLMTGTTFTAAQTSYTALGYRAWSPNWGALLPGDDQIGPNTGLPAPTLRAQVGDTVRVHLRNNDTHYRFPHSIHVHGLRYEPTDDGAFIAGGPYDPASAILVGGSHTYTYTAVASSVGTWPYHDHSRSQSLVPPAPQPAAAGDHGEDDAPGMAGVAELGTQLGLAGVIAVTGPETAPVDVENVLVLIDMYHSNIPALAQDLDLFNGAAFLNNTPTFTAQVGQRVRWRIVALGKELHVFHIHGHRWWDGIRWVDAQVLGPSTSLTIEYIEDSPGDWLYHCHVTDHMMGGMVGRYHVDPARPIIPPTG
jgi:FtsP/CotA-like multicopper oxidase with cupredoxin domain